MSITFNAELEECRRQKNELIKLLKTIVLQSFYIRAKKYLTDRKKNDYFI